jgi:hypothetical protein
VLVCPHLCPGPPHLFLGRKYLLSIIDPSNCERLHQLADFFDCTPLKLTAWRVIQESKPGYSTAPAEILQALSSAPTMGPGAVKGAPRKFIGHGLIGPGERLYDVNYQGDQPGVANSSSARAGQISGSGGIHDESDEDDDEETVSIFNTTVSGNALAEEGLLSSGQKRYDYYVRPDQLPKGTPAKEVVRSWAFRLQQVYQECCEQQGIVPDRVHPNAPRQHPSPPSAQRSAQQLQIPPSPMSQQGQSSGAAGGIFSTPQSRGSVLPNTATQQSQQQRRSQATNGINRMPSFDRISDISDPPQHQQLTQTQERGSPQRPSVRPSITNSQSVPTLGIASRTSQGATPARGSMVPPQGRGGLYPQTIEEKETDSVSTEEKEMTYSKQPFQTNNPRSTGRGAGGGGGGSFTIDWKEELRRFYISRGLTDKLDSLETILTAWEGKEKDMIEALYGKYNMKIPLELQEKLRKWDELYGEDDLESRSER